MAHDRESRLVAEPKISVSSLMVGEDWRVSSRAPGSANADRQTRKVIMEVRNCPTSLYHETELGSCIRNN